MRNNKSKKPLKNSENVQKVQKAQITANTNEKVVLPKNAYTALSKIAIVILHLVGFPLLLYFTYTTSKFYDDSGLYKITVYLPFVLAIIFWALTLLIQFQVFRHDKKKHRSFKHTMLACTAIPLCFLSGLYLVIDIVLPKPFVGATSNTILYEDIVVDAKGKHEHFEQIAHSFMYKNNMYVYEKNPDGTPKELETVVDPDIDPHFKQYKGTAHEGQPIPERLRKPRPVLDSNGEIQYFRWFSDENKKLFDQMFASFDSAYKVFNGLAVEYALSEPDIVGGILDGSIPITVMLTIILKTSPNEYELDVKRDLFEILSMNMDTIVAAVKELIATGFDFSTEFNPYTGKDENLALDKVLRTAMISLEYNNIKWNILQLLGDNPLSNVDPNGDIYMYPGTLQEVRIGGCQGYQDMAWLNSIDLLGMVCCLLDCRKYFYIFGTVTALLTYLIFLIKKRYLVVTGKDLTLLPHPKRDAKDQAKNYFFSTAVNTMADIDMMEEKEAKPKDHKVETTNQKIEEKAFVAVKEQPKKEEPKKEEKHLLNNKKDKKDKKLEKEESKKVDDKDIKVEETKAPETTPLVDKKENETKAKPILDFTKKAEPSKSEIKPEPVKPEIKVEPNKSVESKIELGNKVEPKKVEPEKKAEPIIKFAEQEKKVEPAKVEIKEEPKIEPAKVEIKPEPVKPEVKPEPAKVEIKPEPVKPEVKPEPVKPTAPQKPVAPAQRPVAPQRPAAPAPRPAVPRRPGAPTPTPARRPAARPGAPVPRKPGAPTPTPARRPATRQTKPVDKK